MARIGRLLAVTGARRTEPRCCAAGRIRATDRSSRRRFWIAWRRRAASAARAFGVSRSDVREIVAASLRASSMKANPVVLEAGELTAAVEAAL